MSRLALYLSSANLRPFARTFSFYQQQRLSSQSSTENKELPSAAPDEEIYAFPEEKSPELTEEEILAKRNKSGLSPAHYRMANGQMPYTSPQLFIHRTVKYQRKMYAIHGEKSGIPPGLQWPDYEDLQSRLEYESVAYPFTFQEMVDIIKEKRRQEKEAIVKRAAEVEEKMATLEKMKAELLKKKEAKDKEFELAQERREQLIEEVRRHFGYKVDPREERFQELLEKKEKEQRKAMKETRKQEREQKMMTLLLGKQKKKSVVSRKDPAANKVEAVKETD